MEGDLLTSCISMATQYLAVDLVGKPFPFQQATSFNATRYSTVPWGQAIVDHSFDTPSVPAGDDGVISIDIELPSDYVAMLRNFHLQVVSGNAINWDSSVIGFAYQTPGGPYKTTVAGFPEDDYSWYSLLRDQTESLDRFASTKYYHLWTMGVREASTDGLSALNDAWDPTQLPLWIPPSVDAGLKSRSVVIYMTHPVSASGFGARAATIRASFDLYTLDQAYSAAVMSSPRVFT